MENEAMTRAEPLMKPMEVARLLNVSPAYVVKLSKLGKLKRVEIGGAVRYTPESVRAIYEAQAEERS